MNINDFAVEITKEEKGKKQVSIAQVKEILKVIRILLKNEADLDIYTAIRKI